MTIVPRSVELRKYVVGLVRKHGWYVFRLRLEHVEEDCNGGASNCKRIVFIDSSWAQTSSNDTAVVASWDWADANAYGIDCGKSRLVVADQDPGDDWPFRDTRVHTTGRGRHYLYEDLIGLGNRTGLAPWGIDVRGVGGMVVGPGSWHPHGEYEVEKDVAPAATPAVLAEAVDGVGVGGVALGSYLGPVYEDLLPSLQRWAHQEVAAVVEFWRARLEEAEGWPDGEKDDQGRGWEALSRDAGWALAMMAACPWTGLDEEGAEMLYELILPQALASNEKCRGKWYRGIVDKARLRPVAAPPWESFPDLDIVVPVTVDVTNDALALRWLALELGQGQLSGAFQRGADLVHTPRVGERGYIPPKNEEDSSGPAQVRRIDALELTRRIDATYSVVRGRGKGVRPGIFPIGVASRAVAVLDLLPNVRILRGVTHTPVVLVDGSVLNRPGYDPDSGVLYLPEPDLLIPPVPERPGRVEMSRASRLLEGMLWDFPFVNLHDRANYMGALLTPMLRSLVPPPYKLIAIGAPQRGSGKSLLAWILRELHGGVFKSEFPLENDEVRKFVTSTLDATTAPVVQFDNVTGVLRSSVLEGLLTSAEWSDRLLGKNEIVTRRNDRMWVVTGNNIHIGGDLERRTLWVTIDPNMEHPEARSGFRVPDLEGWVTQNRGELLWALLVLIRGWVVAGRPVEAAPTSDGFGRWVQVLRGILVYSGWEGVVGHPDSVRSAADPEEQEWATFLAAAHRTFGAEPWTVSELLEKVSEFGEEDGILPGELPIDVSAKTVGRDLGKWLAKHENRWAEGFVLRSLKKLKRGSKVWLVNST